MKCLLLFLTTIAAFGALTQPARALSEELRSPRICFAKGFDVNRATAITHVLSEKRLQFRDGIISYWQPQFHTTLNYAGDAAALNSLITSLREVHGIAVHISFVRRRAEVSWEVNYVHTEPDTLSIAVNLKAQKLNLEELRLPKWKRDK